MATNKLLKNKNSGFTIVELLIVIVVIGILALLVITTYSGIQGKARNSKRQTDLASLQTHLEAYYNDNGYYPTLDNLNSATWVKANMKGTDLGAFSDPSDPANSTLVTGTTAVAKKYAYDVRDTANAVCTTAANCTSYTLTAKYEGTVNGADTYVKSSLN